MSKPTLEELGREVALAKEHYYSIKSRNVYGLDEVALARLEVEDERALCRLVEAKLALRAAIEKEMKVGRK